jgi:tRNA G18 (ribose-2'-O)-methylase SpoU
MKKNNFNFYLLIYNIQSKHNIKTLIQTALNFNCHKFLILGNIKTTLLKIFQNNKEIQNKFEFFEEIEQLKNYLSENKIKTIGIEIGKNSIPIQNFIFEGNSLFILGNEANGMNQKQKNLCENFVYIQQYSNKTGSLNVAIAASIIFHHFFVWNK